MSPFCSTNIDNHISKNWIKKINIVLETSDSVFVEDHSKLKICSNGLYTCSNGPIYHFKLNGEFVNKFGGIGHAENEYTQLNDIFVNQETNEIEIMTPHMLKIFDYDGNYKYSKKLGTDAFSFFHEKDHYWCVNPIDPSNSNFEIVMLNNKMEKENEFLNRKFTIPSQIQIFGNCPVKNYHFYFSYDVYHIDTENKTVVPAYKFHFPGMEMPESFKFGTMDDYINSYEKIDYSTILSCMENNRYIYLLIDEYAKSVHNLYHWIIDKKTEEEHVVNVGNWDNLLGSYHTNPQLLDDKNILYFFGVDNECMKNDNIHVIGVDLSKLFE